MSSNLAQFGLAEMLRCGMGVRRAASDAATLQHAMDGICRFLYNELQGPDERRACALVRGYKTHRYGALSAEDRRFARRALGITEASDDLRCLTLMGTAGDEPAWNDRRSSRAHRVIPLPRADVIQQAPMIAQLIRQFGLDLGTVAAPSADIVSDLEGRTYGVFHVERAAGSPYIPAQEKFVLPYGIQSVVGCGGSLRGADLFAIILFSRVHISEDAAERFRTIALDVKSVLFSYEEERVFATS